MNKFTVLWQQFIRTGKSGLGWFAHRAGGSILGRQFVLSVAFSLALLVICLLPWFFVASQDYPTYVRDPSHKSKEIAVFNSSGKRWFEWPATDAIKFSLDQLVTTLRY